MSILYPPIVDTYMPAFTNECTITFSIPSLNSLTDMSDRMVVSIVDQKTNQSVLPHGIMIVEIKEGNQIHIDVANYL